MIGIRMFTVVTGCLLFLWGCSPRIYRPPALGAEYRFDEGLKPQRPKERLFSPGMRHSLEKAGQVSKPSKSNMGLTATSKRDSTGNLLSAGKKNPQDSITTPASPASPALPDSSHSGPR